MSDTGSIPAVICFRDIVCDFTRIYISSVPAIWIRSVTKTYSLCAGNDCAVNIIGKHYYFLVNGRQGLVHAYPSGIHNAVYRIAKNLRLRGLRAFSYRAVVTPPLVVLAQDFYCLCEYHSAALRVNGGGAYFRHLAATIYYRLMATPYKTTQRYCAALRGTASESYN